MPVPSNWTDATRSRFEASLPPGTHVIYCDGNQSGTTSGVDFDIDLSAFADCGYLDSWPLPGEPAPPWLPPNARTHKAPRWLPPRCHLPALVPRRDFPRLAT